MSGAVFARAVRNRLRSIPLAVDLSFPDPNDATNMLVVDQVIIGDKTTIQAGSRRSRTPTMSRNYRTRPRSRSGSFRRRIFSTSQCLSCR